MRHVLQHWLDHWRLRLPDIVVSEPVTSTDALDRHAERLDALTARLHQLDAEILLFTPDDTEPKGPPRD